MIWWALRHPRVQPPPRAGARATWLGAAILSSAAGRETRLAGALGAMGLFMAYGLAAFVTRLAFRHTRSRWQLSAFLIVAGVSQCCVMARHGVAVGWLAAGAGATVGIVIARAVDHLSLRPRRQPSRTQDGVTYPT